MIVNLDRVKNCTQHRVDVYNMADEVIASIEPSGFGAIRVNERVVSVNNGTGIPTIRHEVVDPPDDEIWAASENGKYQVVVSRKAMDALTEGSVKQICLAPDTNRISKVERDGRIVGVRRFITRAAA